MRQLFTGLRSTKGLLIFLVIGSLSFSLSLVGTAFDPHLKDSPDPNGFVLMMNGVSPAEAADSLSQTSNADDPACHDQQAAANATAEILPSTGDRDRDHGERPCEVAARSNFSNR